MYKVRITGTVQSNGSHNVNKTILVDKTQMQMMTGARRKETMEEWIRVNYPGAKSSSRIVASCIGQV